MGYLVGIQIFVVVPDSAGQGLVRPYLPGPLKDLFQQGQRGLIVAAVSGFIVKIPQKDSVILLKRGQNVLFIVPQCVPGCRIIVHLFTRALYPAAVVDTRFWIRLFTWLRVIVPAIIEEHKNGFNVTAGCY